ncbi:hypothetical protein GT354_42805, partial [Streptomyces sp. SID3343]|nr:hypothetical protein [Streptomyces sp. SID3343]
MTRRDEGSAAGFEPATGAEVASAVPPEDDARERRAAAVRDAFEALLRIRRVVNDSVPDPASVPAAWERGRMVRAVALSLEA